MVWMPVIFAMQQQNPGFKHANKGNDFPTLLRSVLQSTVGKFGVVAYGDLENLGGFLCLFHAFFYGAARAEFPECQIENTG